MSLRAIKAAHEAEAYPSNPAEDRHVATRRQQIAARRRLVAKLRLHRKAVTWLGLALSAGGVAVIAFPSVGPVIVGAVAGWLLWFVGAIMFVVSVLVGSERLSFGGLLTSLAAIAGGSFLYFHPEAGAMATALVVASVLILDGAFELALALDLRPVAAWRWVLTSSIASGLAGVIMAAGAGGSRSLVAVLIGLAFASTGVALLALGRTRRASRRKPLRRQAAVFSRSPSTPST